MPLSGQQLKQIKRRYPSQTPDAIARELGIGLYQVYKALGMHREFYQILLNRTAQVTFMLMLVCSPFLFIRGLNDFADLPQRTFLQAGTLVLALLYAADAALRRKIMFPSGMLPALASLFVLWTWLATAWARSPYDAVYTALHWSCGPVLLVLVTGLLHIPSACSALLSCVTAALCGTVLLGLLQYFFDVRLVPQSIKPAAGFANPNVAAEYVALVLPAVVAHGLTQKRRFGRILLVMLLPCALLFLAFTQCRAAWLALCAASIWTLLLIMKTKMQRKIYYLTLLVCAAALGAGTAILYSEGAFRRIIHLTGGSAVYRTIVWENSLEMLKDRPLLGFGPGGFKVFYPGYKDKAAVDRAFDKEKQIRRAHNDYVQVAVETGIPGFLLFLGILLCGLVSALRAVGSSACPVQHGMLVGVSASIVSFMTVAFFGFPFQRAVQPIVVFLFLALLWGSRQQKIVSIPLPHPAGYAAVASICMASLVLVQFNIRTIIADRYFQTAVQFEKSRANKKALEASLKAHNLIPSRMDVLTTLGRAYITTGDLDKGIAALEQVVQTQPYNLNALFILGSAYANKGDKEQALAAFKRVLQIKPDFPEARKIVCGLKTRSAVRVNIL